MKSKLLRIKADRYIVLFIKINPKVCVKEPTKKSGNFIPANNLRENSKIATNQAT